MKNKNLLTSYFIFVLMVLGNVLFAQTDLTLTVTDEFGKESTTISCAIKPLKNTLLLSANYNNVFSTETYKVSSTPYQYYPINLPENALKVTSSQNNKFFKKIPIGFEFCYFGNKFSDLLVGSNGVVTFDKNFDDNFIYPDFSAQNPSSQLPTNAIFGALQTIVIDNAEGSDIYVSTIGTAPNRKLIISYHNAKLLYNGTNTTANCSDIRTSTQIILHEGTNAIEVALDNKPLPCDDSGFKNALVGIVNNNATVGFTAPSRNTGVWSANKESWLFLPNGSQINPIIEWFDSSNNVIGNSKDLTVTIPTYSTAYKAKLTYNFCDSSKSIEDDYSISYTSDYPAAKDLTKIYCNPQNIDLQSVGGEMLDINTDISKIDFSFYKDKDEAKLGVGTTYSIVSLNSFETFYVRIQNKLDATCFSVVKLDLKVFSSANLNTNVSNCESNKNNYELLKLKSQIVSDPNFQEEIMFYSDANGTNKITNATITNGMTVWIKTTNCQTLIPIKINLIPGPPINSPLNITRTICDNNNDNFEFFDYKQFDSLISNNPSSVKIRYYHNFYDLAFTGSTYEATGVVGGLNIIYFRVDDTTTKCFSIGVIYLDIKYNKIIADNKNVYYCFNGTEDVTIDLTNSKIIESMVKSPVTSATSTFYSKREDADLPTPINPITTFKITDDVPNGGEVAKTVFVRFDYNGCYSIAAVTINLIHLKPQLTQNKLLVCDTGTTGTETIILEDVFYENQIKGNLNGVHLKYFSDASLTNEITKTPYTVTGNNQIYVQMTSTYSPFLNESCVKSYPITLVLTPVPVVKPFVESIMVNGCDLNANGYEIFNANTVKKEIYSGTDEVDFYFYDNYDPATNTFSNIIRAYTTIRIANGKRVIYVKVVNTKTGCFSKSEIRFDYSFNPSTIKLTPATLILCSLTSPTYNLSLATPDLFNQTNNTINLNDIKIEYFKTYDADTELVSDPIPNPYSTNRSRQTVYARFTSVTNGCYSIVPISLESYLPPIGRMLIKEICQYEGFNLQSLSIADLLSTYNSDAKYELKFFTATRSPIDITQLYYPKNNEKVYFTIKIIGSNAAECATESTIEFRYNLDNKVPLKLQALRIPDAELPCDIGNDGVEPFAESFLNAYMSSLVDMPATYVLYNTDPDINFPAIKYSGVLDKNITSYNPTTKEFKLYALIYKDGYCPNRVEITLKLRETPMFDLKDQTFCPEEKINIPLDLEFLGVTKYVWTYPNGKTVESYKVLNFVNIPGKYKVTAYKNNGCTYTDEFTVTEKDTPKIDRVVFDGNTAIIYATGDPAKKIWYSIALEGASENTRVWGTSNVFNNLPPGVHSFRVQYAGEECSSYQKLGLVLDMRKNIITPNDDGYNDKWVIKRLDTFEGQNSQLKIFD